MLTSEVYANVRLAVLWIITSYGYYRIMIKCAHPQPKLAFIPIVREYQLGITARREKEGRTLAKLEIFLYICFLLFKILGQESKYIIIPTVFVLAIGFACLIYSFRILSGLCGVFGRKKRWLWLWIFFEPLTSIIWGVDKKFVPVLKLEIIDDPGVGESGTLVSAVDNGLTVNITKRTVIDFFRKKYLLKDIHLNIPAGHMVLLLGGSGAGKTTFVNAVTGYEQADASILLNDNDLYKDYKEMKYDVGFVPQQDLMRENDSVIRTLMDAATLRLPESVDRASRRERVMQVLEEFGLSSIRNSLVEKLSGGQKKRLSIAMEFISDPSLFILDEPDSGLDGVVARGLFEKLREIADSGKIVIVITHTPDRVIDLFDDVIVLAKDSSRTGRLAYYGPVEDVYGFFGKESMEQILLSVNQKDEGGEGRADEFVENYMERARELAVGKVG
ncbi:MAG: ABC transporter ATP-binding protein [Lachnospiraceae bacterium]|nr:ABC transporter ATP-binding protein [Lachnospiraceae bacterium]